MNTHADKTQAKGQPMVKEASQRQRSGEATFQFVDNRPEAIAQRKLQELADNSPPARQVVQRKIEITGDKVYGTGDADTLKAKYKEEWKEILRATSEFGNAPKTLEDAVSDKRHYVMTRLEDPDYGVFWTAELKAVEEAKEGGKTRVAGDTPVLVLRPEAKFEELKISGLIMCVGIVVEARGSDDKIKAAAGAHFVTPNCMEKSSTSTSVVINSQGLTLIKGLIELATPHGKLSAILMTAQGLGGKKSKSEEDAEQAVKLITSALGMPVTVTNGDSTRYYQLSADGKSKV